MYTPLINSETGATYSGFDVKLGETPGHYEKRPALKKIGTKKILGICIGASTPGQISTAIESKSISLKNVQIINTCRGGQDINAWSDLNSPAWSNLNSTLLTKKASKNDVQFIIMTQDDLRNMDTTFPADANSLAAKLEILTSLLKSQFPNLKMISMMSRLCEYKITEQKFQTPSGYHNGWGNKFFVEKAIAAGGFINGVWITDADGYLWTDGEKVRSDSFAFSYSWMKQNATSVHLDTAKQGDEICADFVLNNFKRRYSWFV